MKYKDIIVEIDDADKVINLPKEVCVYVNFDPSNPPIGTAKLRIEDGKILGDINIIPNIDVDHMYPAIKGRKDHESGTTIAVIDISLCSTRNVDLRIENISKQTGKERI